MRMGTLPLRYVAAGTVAQIRCTLLPSLSSNSRRALSTTPVILEENSVSEAPKKAPIALDLGGINISNPAPALTFAQRLAARRAAQLEAEEQRKASGEAAGARGSARKTESAERSANIRARSNSAGSAPRLNSGHRGRGFTPQSAQEEGDRNFGPRRAQNGGDGNYGARRAQGGGGWNYGPRTREGGEGQLASPGGMNRPHDQLGLKPEFQGERRPYRQRTGAENAERGKFQPNSPMSKGRKANPRWNKKRMDPTEPQDPRQGDPELNDYAESGRPTRTYNAEGLLVLKGKHMQLNAPIAPWPQLPLQVVRNANKVPGEEDSLTRVSVAEVEAPVATGLSGISYAGHAPPTTVPSRKKRVVYNAQVALGRLRGLNTSDRERAMKIVREMARRSLAVRKAGVTRTRATA